MTRNIAFTVMAALAALTTSVATAQDSCCASKPSVAATAGPADPKHEQHAADAGGAASCCSKSPAAQGSIESERGMGHGRGGRGAVMPDAMHLLHNHAALERSVENLPNGVKTRTTTKDAAVLALLRRHPRDMYSFYESGGSVRPHDPLFRELSRVADSVTMEFKDIENGIEVVATSEDPEVVKLLQAHAAKVTEFVKRGMAALHEGAPLPENYNRDR